MLVWQPSPFLIPMPCIQVTHSPGLLRRPNWDFNNCPRPIESGLGLMTARIKVRVEGFLGEGRHRRASSLIWARLLLSMATGEWKSLLAGTESASSISRSDNMGTLNGPCSPGPFPDLPSFLPHFPSPGPCRNKHTGRDRGIATSAQYDTGMCCSPSRPLPRGPRLVNYPDSAQAVASFQYNKHFLSIFSQ